MPRLLRLDYLEAKPKRVHDIASWTETVGLRNRPDLQTALTQIRSHIVRGMSLAPRFYSKYRDRRLDALLAQEGIMHLHLGDQNTRELLFVMQFDTHVVFLEVSDHAPIREHPPGSTLKARHGRTVERWRAETEATARAKQDDIRRRLSRSKKPPQE